MTVVGPAPYPTPERRDGREGPQPMTGSDVVCPGWRIGSCFKFWDPCEAFACCSRVRFAVGLGVRGGAAAETSESREEGACDANCCGCLALLIVVGSELVGVYVCCFIWT
jgi:hypothetical protein